MKITKRQLRRIIKEEKLKLINEAEDNPSNVLNRALGGMDELRHRLKSHMENPESMDLRRVDSMAEEVELRIKHAMELMDMYIATGRR